MFKHFVFLSLILSTFNAYASCAEEDFFALQNELANKIEKLEKVTYFYTENEKVSGSVEARKITRDLMSVSYRTNRIKGAFLIGFDVLKRKFYLANYMEGAAFQKIFIENKDILWCEKIIKFPSGELALEIMLLEDISISLVNQYGEILGRWSLM